MVVTREISGSPSNDCALDGVGGAYIDAYHTYICGQVTDWAFLGR